MIIQGVILIDKPQGPTSFDVVRKIKKLSGQKRVGHAGTLDPEASGLLVVCLGSYTKLCGYLTQSSKIYEAEITLGIQTSTDDAEGEIILEKPVNLSAEDIKLALNKFTGKIEQIPPKYSAIKINGQRAYKLARADEEFSIKAREVEIFSLQVLNLNLPNINIQTHCSKGTYIRALARDVGNFLNVGGHARNIRRIASGKFEISQAIKLEDLTAQNIQERCLTGTDALGGLYNFVLNQAQREHIKHGRRVFIGADSNIEIGIALFENKPVAIMKNQNQNWQIVRVI